MTRNARIILRIIALFGLVIVLPGGDALAQQKEKVSYKVSAENTKYTQQVTIDAGDTPGHEVRVFEIHRTVAADAPVINGIKLTDTWTRGFSDSTDYNGPSTSYVTYVFEIRRQVLCPHYDAWTEECRRQAHDRLGWEDHRRHRQVRWNPGNDAKLGPV